MKIIEDLFNKDRQLLGKGYDESLEYINNIIPLKIGKVKSGTKVADWIVPDEWIIRDAWVKFNGKKILDYKENPFSVVQYSAPIHQIIDLAEFKKHLHVSDERPDAFPYEYKFYERDWGFCMKKNDVLKHVIQKCEGGICTEELKEIDPTIGQVWIEGSENPPQYKEILEEGEYEVYIDSEFKKGELKYGVHTINGNSDREILLFAHLDHPYQANDNLSGVACLVDMADRLHDAFYEHTIKLIFCPETIGSIAYAEKEDISKVDFVIAVDAVGNDNSILMQKAFNKESRLNYIMHLASSGHAVDYRKAEFRHVVGSDEYYFNDPKVGIPGIMLSRIPYKEYHTSEDTPLIIKDEKIKEVQDVIMRIIDMYERDYIPSLKVKGPIMKSKYEIHTPHKFLNLGLDILFYSIDGKKYLSELVLPTGLGFDFAHEALEKVSIVNESSSSHTSKKRIKKTSK